ncbi:MAG: hypothetical protein FWK04_32985, partial [Nostoc sp. GBBB01]|nr:hypothetical protein [Nostoc sp. GBBB01]
TSMSMLPVLRPYVWQGQFIPILPSLLIDFVESPGTNNIIILYFFQLKNVENT